MTSIARQSTELSEMYTETAAASITPIPTATSAPTSTTTPVPPTPTPDRPLYDFDSANLPDAVFTITDPLGDAFICSTGEPVYDRAADILSVMIFDPQSLGSAVEGWFARIEMDIPANTTFAVDWSATLMAGYAAVGAGEYTFNINEVHNHILRRGILDSSLQTVLPETASHTFIDDQGNFWFFLPSDTTYLYLSSFHLPAENLPAEEKRCDLAPDKSAYTLELQ